MAKDITIELNQEQYDRLRKFGSPLGYMAWNIGVIVAPKDTGNLARAITLKTNTKKKKTIRYNLMEANYIKFLEYAMGSVKIHKGFISNDTLLAISEGVISYAKSGIINPYLLGTPKVRLGSSTQVFGGERAILRQNKINTNNISANVRQRISRLREREYRKNQGIDSFNVSGKRVSTTNNFSYGSNKGSSTLSKAYTKAKGG